MTEPLPDRKLQRNAGQSTLGAPQMLVQRAPLAGYRIRLSDRRRQGRLTGKAKYGRGSFRLLMSPHARTRGARSLSAFPALRLFQAPTAALLLLAGLSAVAFGLPDVPAIDRDVALIRSEQFTYPHIPPLRTTADGRVGISPKPIGGMVRFYVLVPELIADPFVDSLPGDRILAGLAPFEVPESRFLGGDNGSGGRHYTICDTTAEFHSPEELTSPYACGSDRRDDCYDFVVVTSTGPGLGSKKRQLWGTLVTVRVSNPKTVNAAIARVTTATPRTGPTVRADVLFEPMITNDGRLLSGRIATNNFEWTSPETNVSHRHFVDIVYSFNRTGEACDVAAWDTFYPISHAPYDPTVNSRYGFAMYPFRDATGEQLPDGADLGISYPWLDRRGRNLFFTSVNALLKDPPFGAPDSVTRYPARCLPETQCGSRPELPDTTRGQGVVGLWTRGKMVLFDGILNNTDYGLALDDGSHRLLQLYRDGSGPSGGESGEVRVGTGRDVADFVGPSTYIRNTTIVDSLENSFNAIPQLRPVAPRDVTWIVDSGKASDEIAFDDWLDLDAFIVSEMVGATSYESTSSGRGVLRYYDGWRDGAFRDAIQVQNAATTLPGRWRVPPAGVAYGNVRLEPVALGGVRGKGLWLDGQSGIEYDIAEQNVGTDDVPWYLGIFLDSRFDDEEERTLINFPDGARIRLRGRSALLYSRADGTTAREIDLIPPLPYGSWTHLGFQLLPNGAGVTFYRNGFAFDFASADVDPGFRLAPGSLFVGNDRRDPTGGVRGWVDGFVVIARELGPELACNHAAGTLAGLGEDGESDASPSGEWARIAKLYPSWAHERIRARLADRDSFAATEYVCFHGYHHDYENHRGNLPSGLHSVRRELVFPEGPLAYGQPRPDSSTNSFCLSCHSPGEKGGLSTDALVLRPDLPMEDDPRRQPLQPLRRVFGNLPMGWLGQGRPRSHVEAPASGLKVDALLEGVIDPVEAVDSVIGSCAGDCDADDTVTVDELVQAVSITLGRRPFAACRRGFDCGPSENCIAVSDLTRAVANALNGCSSSTDAR